MTKVQAEVLANAGRSAVRAMRCPGVVHGSILLTPGELSAARALVRRGLVAIVVGVNGGTVASRYARPVGTVNVPWAS